MKKFVIFIILAISVGSSSYIYLHHNGGIYGMTLPATYENFEKDMFKALLKLKKEDKDLLLNYSIRFKKMPTQITVKEAIENERIFEKTNEGVVFFSRLKEEEKRFSLIEEVNTSAFITFVDFSKQENSIDIIFSIKNKSAEAITQIIGDSSFEISNDKFSTTLEFNTMIPATETVQIVKKFNFSEFPALKELSNKSSFRLNIRQIHFASGSTLSIN